MEVVDIHDKIEKEVLDAYCEVLETLQEGDIAPSLEEVTEVFIENIMTNIQEVYEEVFGEGSEIREDWLFDMGIDMKSIPNIITVCKVLNAFKLGYLYNDTLFNPMQQSLFREEEFDIDE